MIERYTRSEMREIFNETEGFNRYLNVELAVLEALEETRKVPRGTARTIKESVTIDPKRIREIEKTTKHDLVAFVNHIGEQSDAASQWLHYGLTSTDVIDTAHALAYKQANRLIERGIERVRETLKSLALTHKDTLMMGRTHGMHADVTTFGLKCAQHYGAFTRSLERFQRARCDIETGKLSGAVGTHTTIDPQMQDKILESLELYTPSLSTQVLWRDAHAHYASVLSLISGSIEQLAVEIRHLSRSEIGEVREGFAKNQTGSSLMPHKKNPIASENLTGCARMMRGYMQMAHENIALWHERDISHSSVERVAFIDSIILLDYMLERLDGTLKKLHVDEDTMRRRVENSGGTHIAQHLLHALIDSGMARKDAYARVQKLAFDAEASTSDFITLCKKDALITGTLPTSTLEALFDNKSVHAHIDTLFKRVGIQ